MGRTFEGERSTRGFSLMELMIAIGLIGIMAMIAVPTPAPSREYNLELAASEVADAIRFARNEAMRTGEPHGFHTQQAQNRLRVYRADMGTVPPTPIFDVYHPVLRQLHDLDLDLNRLLAGVTISATSASWRGVCTAPDYVGFDAAGVPRCGDPWPVTLDAGTLTLSSGTASLVVVLDGETGRTHVQ